MSKPLVVSIPHNLGKAEAMRRLQGGLTRLKSQFGDKVASVEETWSGDRMDFRVGAMGQSINGHLQVFEEQVKVEVQLPWLLAMVAEKAKNFIQKQGTLMLEKK
ncbi:MULTISPECIES: polyhydroxyalkanoic acid system family protein [Microvirga]|uniref:polyhydroxyalkanoic acid system family protein n=1 Tax=Microvirga TaxID=186650 RepID=UPI001CFEFB19|nr:polyhydroxyalkanoic acid system family protein [Microvirga lenta]MCB5174410.1 polyhydroxyalkanoic acid system family protein [Microvirga lenta]